VHYLYYSALTMLDWFISCVQV